MPYFAEIDLSIKVPGLDNPVRIKQFVPIKISTTAAATEPIVYEVAAGGGKRKSQEIVAGGSRIVVPGSVASVLRDLAACHGAIRIRVETFRKLAHALPEVAELLQRDPDLKVIDKCAPYRVPETLRARIRVQ